MFLCCVKESKGVNESSLRSREVSLTVSLEPETEPMLCLRFTQLGNVIGGYGTPIEIRETFQKQQHPN
jgi:hypothetical protein